MSAFILAVFLSLPACPPAAAAVQLSNGLTRCTVRTPHYQLVVDVTRDASVRLLGATGTKERVRLESVWLQQGAERFASSAAAPHPHLHSLRAGPYLVELHVENIRLTRGNRPWPGIAELSLFCHEDRVYLRVSFLCPQGKWVNRGRYVYQVPEQYDRRSGVNPSDLGFVLRTARPATSDGPRHTALLPPALPLAVQTTVPAGARLSVSGTQVTVECPGGKAPGSRHANEVGAVLLVATDKKAREHMLAVEDHPLAGRAFRVTRGEWLGYDPASGTYRLLARTSPTPTPPRGLRGGTQFTVHNDSHRRTILVDQRDPWGGIGGGILRDGRGEPLPVVIQFGLNFPELHQQAGEPGWATLTYPLHLAPRATRTVRAEHLYHGLTDREIMYLTSLENIGNPLLLQTTVGRNESHTVTTGRYPGPRKPGNELRINDFRRIYSQLRVRSVSAVLPTFFGYWDADEEYQGLVPGAITLRETGPFLIEYTVAARTTDGAVSGTVRVWQAAQAGMTRVFTDVTLHVNRSVPLSRKRPAPLFFLRHHAFNPMAFSRVAYTATNGHTRECKLTYTRSIVVNGAPLGPFPFACLYRADNRLDQGLPCSDITGNGGFVLLDWRVTAGNEEVRPGIYAFCTGADDEEAGPYARDVAVVPTSRLASLPRGSRIHYRAVQMVWGTNASDYRVMERERRCWALTPLRVNVTRGRRVSDDPPEVRAVGGRCRFTLSGGRDWLPVRVVGFIPGRALHVRQTDSTGLHRLGPVKPGEPWYNAWPDPGQSDACGFTFLVKKPPGEKTIELTVGP